MLSLELTCACSIFAIVLQLAFQLRLQVRRLVEFSNGPHCMCADLQLGCRSTQGCIA